MRSGPGAGRTILLFHIISSRPSKQPRMVRTFLKVYMEFGSYFLFLQEQIKDIIIYGPSGKRTGAKILTRALLCEEETCRATSSRPMDGLGWARAALGSRLARHDHVVWWCVLWGRRLCEHMPLSLQEQVSFPYRTSYSWPTKVPCKTGGGGARNAS